MPYMKWGNKSEKGCSGTTCGKCHPTLCPKSLDLRCLDRQCPWKLHTYRCSRADSGTRRGGSRDQTGNDWIRVDRNGRGGKGQRGGGHLAGQDSRAGGGAGQYDRTGTAGHHRQMGSAGQHRQGGGGVPQHAPSTTQSAAWNNQGFQGMTAQQHLLGTIELQLQQAVTRAIMQALSGTVPGWGGVVGRSGGQCPSFLLMNINRLITPSGHNKVGFLYDQAVRRDSLFVGVTETWLHAGIMDAEVSHGFPGYSLHRSDRAGGRLGGGVALYLREDLTGDTLASYAEVHPERSGSVCELLVVKVHQLDTVVCVLYRPPDTRLEEFGSLLQCLDNTLSYLPTPTPTPTLSKN